MFGTFGDIFSKMGGMFGKGGQGAGFGIGQQMPGIPGNLPPQAPAMAGAMTGGGLIPPGMPMPNPQAEGFGIGQQLPGTFSSVLGGGLPQQAQGQGTPMAGMLNNPNLAKILQMMQMRGANPGASQPMMAAGGGLGRMQMPGGMQMPLQGQQFGGRQIMPRG